MAPLLLPRADAGHTSLAEIDTAMRYALAHRPDPDQPDTDAPAPPHASSPDPPDE
jgi:hypothetical protein